MNEMKKTSHYLARSKMPDIPEGDEEENDSSTSKSETKSNVSSSSSSGDKMKSLKERLNTLKSLFEDELIDQTDFDKRKAEILKDI